MIRRLIHRAYLKSRHGKALRILEQLERSQWLSTDEILARQWTRLRTLLQHAAAKVPFYRAAFLEAGIDPGSLRGPEVLASLPVVTKEMLRSRPAEFLSEDASERGALPNQTGGSTGQPLRFYQDEVYRLHRQAVMYRGFRWCGWRKGGPLAYIWGSDIDSLAHRGPGALRDFLTGVTWIDAFYLEERAIDGALAALQRANPDVLIGYASSLRHLARRALARGGGPRLRAVESSAEVLTPEARRDIEAAFACRVFDRYGCREAGVVAHQCEVGEDWHVNAETVLAETDAEGRLLLTTLMNWSMPFIRYCNEDLVELASGRCPCGRGLPLMRKVAGRRTDIIRSPSGRAIHGEFFTHLFYDARDVLEFQVVQKTLHDLVIRVVAGAAFTDRDRARIEAAIRDHGDAAFRVSWEAVAEIPRGPSGKFRFTLSEIDATGAREEEA